MLKYKYLLSYTPYYTRDYNSNLLPLLLHRRAVFLVFHSLDFFSWCVFFFFCFTGNQKLVLELDLLLLHFSGLDNTEALCFSTWIVFSCWSVVFFFSCVADFFFFLRGVNKRQQKKNLIFLAVWDFFVFRFVKLRVHLQKKKALK